MVFEAEAISSSNSNPMPDPCLFGVRPLFLSVFVLHFPGPPSYGPTDRPGRRTEKSLPGTSELTDLSITSDLELGHIMALSLDDEPLATSRRILLQVMSEEKETNRQTEPVGAVSNPGRVMANHREKYFCA